jgi:ADP-heptose:LPS heptosyltransferase
MGDVAMLYPVLQQLGETYPDLKITLVSRPLFKPFFENLPNVSFYEIDLKGRHKKVRGLWQLARQISKLGDVEGIADVHDVLRTKLLRLFLKVRGQKVAVINKGRLQKRRLIRKKRKVFQPLRHSTERYADVFKKLGYPIELTGERIVTPGCGINDRVQQLLKDKKGKKLIGFAPYAFHKGKMMPQNKVESLLPQLVKQTDAKILLFGGGIDEIRNLGKLADRFDGVESVAGKLSIEEEMQLIAQLDVMISMDSANMHIASICGVPVVSVWGATHHYAGFLGYGQDTADIVEIPHDQLTCRPCSVFGSKPCWRGDYACMEWLDIQQIVEKVKQHL